MNNQIQKVLAKLQPMAHPEDEGLILSDIEWKLKQGWTETELVSYLRYCEHVCGDRFEEDYACQRMNAIERAVEERLRREHGNVISS